MKKFNEFAKDDFKLLGRSLESSMSLGGIMFLSSKVGSMTDQEVQDVVDKMKRELLPSDYQPSQNRTLVKMCAMFVF